MSVTFFIIVFGPAFLMVGSFIVWRKFRNVPSSLMLLGFMTQWIFSNIVYLGARYIWPEINDNVIPGQRVLDTMDILGGISSAGFLLAVVSFVVFSMQLRPNIHEKKN